MAMIGKNKKGQAALDFMMTYGWAILLVVIIAVALFAMGIFEPSNFVGSKAAGFGGVTVKGWTLTEAGTFTIRLSNTVGVPIKLDSINVTIGGISADVPVTNVTIAVGEDTAIFSSTAGVFGVQPTGAGYTGKVQIKYTDINAGFPYVSSGTVTAKVS